MTGVGLYVMELVRALATLAPDRVVRLGVRPTGPAAGLPASGRDSVLRGRLHLAWLQAFADGDARAAQCDLVHYTNAVAPLRASVPFVLTIQDLSVLRHPLQHPTQRLAAAPVIVSAARRARFIIVPSRATADEIQRMLHVPSARVIVVPLAARPLGARDPDRSVVTDLGLEAGRYVVALGTLEPRKNGARLIAAFERVAVGDPGLRLVFAGGRGWRDRGFRQALRASPARDRIVLAGYRSDAAVAALLEGCAVMAYPSLYEGFGLPVLEAMAAGAPVVTSRVSSLPEAAGGAAVLVDPHDVGSIAAGLVEAMARRTELAALGRARAAGRTWLDVGRETLAVYERAIAHVP